MFSKVISLALHFPLKSIFSHTRLGYFSSNIDFHEIGSFWLSRSIALVSFRGVCVVTTLADSHNEASISAAIVSASASM